MSVFYSSNLTRNQQYVVLMIEYEDTRFIISDNKCYKCP